MDTPKMIVEITFKTEMKPGSGIQTHECNDAEKKILESELKYLMDTIENLLKQIFKVPRIFGSILPKSYHTWYGKEGIKLECKFELERK